MNPTDTPPAGAALAAVRGELTSPRRWAYRVLLTVISVWTAALAALWATEPRPLPTRLHAAFAVMVAIGVGWVGALGWVLARRRCPTAGDRVALAWMAAAACGLALAASVTIALFRGEPGAAAGLGAVGVALLAAAGVGLRRAYALRAELRAKLNDLTTNGPTDTP